LLASSNYSADFAQLLLRKGLDGSFGSGFTHLAKLQAITNELTYHDVHVGLYRVFLERV